MKKALYIILPIIAILVAIFTILFTPAGSNAVIKPIANKTLANKIKNPKIVITKLDSKYGFVDIDAKSANGVKLNTKGNVDYFKKSFNLAYKVNANKIKVQDREIFAKVDVAGQAVGTTKNFGVNGQGKAFESDVKYKFILKNNKPEAIEANINSAKLSQMFAMANMTPLVDGLAFVNVNMPSLDIKKPSGRANIEIKQGRFNRGLIAKNYGVKLLKDEKFTAKIKANVQKKFIIGNGVIDSATAKLNIKKVTSSLDFLISKGFFNLNIPNLSRLNSVVKQRIRGKLIVDGAFYINSKKKIKQIKLKSKSFGGNIKLSLSNKSLKANLSKVSIPKIIYATYLPKYLSSGLISGNINVPNLKSLNGNFNIGSNGELNPKMLKIELPSYSYKLSTKGSLKNGTIHAKKSALVTSFAQIFLSNTKFAILTKALTTNFTADIKELATLNRLTGKNLRGKIKLNGELKKVGNNINLKAITKSLGGVVKLNYRQDSLSANFKNLAISKLLFIINQPNIINSGVVNGVVKISSLTSLNGLYTIYSKGSLNTTTLQKLYNINLGKNFRYALNIKDGTIKNGVINAKPNLNTSMGSVKFSKLIYNTKNQALSGKYNINIDDLLKLEPVTKQKFNGSVTINGDIKYQNSNIMISGIANEFGGSVNYVLHNNKLTLDAAGVSVVKIAKMLNYPAFLDAISKVHFEYNLKSKKGTYSANLNDARFLNSKLVDMLKQYAKFDLSKELFSNAKIIGNIDDSLVVFNVNTHSQRTKIDINHGVVNTKVKTINSKVHFTFNGNDYQFKVKGSLKNPTIVPVFGGYIKNKIKKKVIQKIFGKDANATSIEQNIGEKVEDKIKKIVPNKVKGLFKNLLHQ